MNIERNRLEMALGTAVQSLATACHEASYAAGWWHMPGSGYPYIPGDSARITHEHETVTLRWDKLPIMLQEMVIHYWPIFLACKVALIHSEVSEGLEGVRKGMMDDKLPHRTAIDAELTDALIREFDLIGAIQRAHKLGVVDQAQYRMTPAATFLEKRGFNATRPDHKIKARSATGGKYF